MASLSALGSRGAVVYDNRADVKAATLDEWVSQVRTDGNLPVDPEMARRAIALVNRWNSEYSDHISALNEYLAASGIAGIEQTRQILSRLPSFFPQLRQVSEFMERAEHQPFSGTSRTAIESVLDPLISEARDQAKRMLGDGPSNQWQVDTLGIVMGKGPARLGKYVQGPLVVLREILKVNGKSYQQEEHQEAEINLWLSVRENRRLFFGMFPTLTRLLFTFLSQWSTQCTLLIRRLDEDRELLKEWLRIDQLEVTEADLDLGDPHVGGATTTRVYIGGRSELIYKPRPLASGQVAERLANLLPMALSFAVPVTVDRGEYGWMKSVCHKGCPNDAAVTRYFERLGALAAVAWCIGSRDLHGFNIIAHGERPYLVDHETILNPGPCVEGLSQGWWLFAESPLTTGILPFARSRRDVSPSALGGDSALVGSLLGLESEREHRGRHREMAPGFRTSIPYRHAPGDVDPLQYHEPFVEGFTTSLDLLSRSQPAAVLDEMAAIPLRVVLRSTVTYAAVLEDGLHPDLLGDYLLREGHFNGLRMPPVVGIPADVTTCEIRDLLRGDIPYFWTEAGSHDLHSGDGRIWPKFFRTSALEEVSRRQRYAASKPEWGHWVVLAALGVAAVAHDNELSSGTCCSEVETADSDQSVVLLAVELIVDRLMALSMRKNRSSDIGWLDVVGAGDGKTWQLEPCGPSLYRGVLGIAVFLGAAGCLLERRELIDVAHKVAAVWLRYYGDNMCGRIGAYEGLCGSLYGLVILNSYAQSRAINEGIENLVGMVCDAPLNENQLDVLSGAAGALLCLLRLQPALSPRWHDPIGQKAKEIGEFLEAKAVRIGHGMSWPSSGGECTLGFAHGSTGIGAALLWLAARTGSRRLRETVDASILWENSQLTSNGLAWLDLRPLVRDGNEHWTTSWCNGSCGVGFGRLLAVLSDPTLESRFCGDIERSVRLAVRDGLGHGHTLCDGDMGQAELLRMAGRVLNRPELRQSARAVAQMVARSVVSSNGKVSSGYGFLDDLPGMMTGLAGVGLSLLGELYPDRVPSPLVLEPPAF